MIKGNIFVIVNILSKQTVLAYTTYSAAREWKLGQEDPMIYRIDYVVLLERETK